MQKYIFGILLCLICSTLPAQKSSPIYVDKNGVMRWTDSHQEASFFGVNYTVPFAHAYRALGYLGIDRKEAIDKDVYHFARLGFNAYRIHIWDVEISDSIGNLLTNEHLDLLDYLIYKLKERNIKIVITAMTTFGNGYPERNQPTEGFSYLYDKCDVHTHPEARKAQQTYISQLISHINPYTGNAYKDDPDVVGFEINNEPCHSGEPKHTREYINGMLTAMKKAGNRKPVFYNVSHNMDHIGAYYSTAIQGTTYQWYPIGLVAGHTRKGNFLPFVDNYDIPFATTRGYENKARLVYEYDPADVTYSYLHPAMVRTFRTAGFQWITQFAYDPLDMARYNTEYQTHFLNLAYTPQKALSMKIAAEVAYIQPRNKTHDAYPNDTVFGDFRVSYSQDISEMNSPRKFFYSNHTRTKPVDPQDLEEVAGYGNSPVVSYEGTGAYFLDKLEPGVWRLEIMPDAVQVSDPFAKPSLDKEVVTIMWGKWDIGIDLPDLGSGFTVKGLNTDNQQNTSASGLVIHNITPGVYLLIKNNHIPSGQWTSGSRWKNITLGEYAAPDAHAESFSVVHTSLKEIETGEPLVIEANIAGPALPDSVLIYTDRISFWRENNLYYKMERTGGYTYRVIIPAENIQKGSFRYNIIVCHAGGYQSFPDGIRKNPLDWDYTATRYWTSRVVDPGSAINLFNIPEESFHGMESYAIPEWSYIRQQLIHGAPTQENTLRFTAPERKEAVKYFIRKYVGDDTAGRKSSLASATHLCIHVIESPESIEAGFVTTTGFTYKTPVKLIKGINRIPLSELRQTATALLPHPYPGFLKKYFEPGVEIPFRVEDIEQLEISFDVKQGTETTIETGSIWVE